MPYIELLVDWLIVGPRLGGTRWTRPKRPLSPWQARCDDHSMSGVPVRLRSVAGDDLGLVHLPAPVRLNDLAATAREIYRVATVVPVPAGLPVALLCQVVPARLLIVAR
jgi:hypothetical protein